MIPEKIKVGKVTYTKHSTHKRKILAEREADKVRINGHIPKIRTFDQKHVVYVKKRKIKPTLDLTPQFKIVNGERFDLIVFCETRQNAREYAKKYKGVLFGEYRIYKEKKIRRYKGKEHKKTVHVIYAKNSYLIG